MDPFPCGFVHTYRASESERIAIGFLANGRLSTWCVGWKLTGRNQQGMSPSTRSFPETSGVCWNSFSAVAVSCSLIGVLPVLVVRPRLCRAFSAEATLQHGLQPRRTQGEQYRHRRGAIFCDKTSGPFCGRCYKMLICQASFLQTFSLERRASRTYRTTDSVWSCRPSRETRDFADHATSDTWMVMPNIYMRKLGRRLGTL